MSQRLTSEQELTLAVTPKTAAGNVGQIDGSPEWSLSDPTLGTLYTTAPDGATLPAGQIVFWPADKATGTLQVVATCDADLGDGVKHIAGTFDIELVAPESTVAEVAPVGEPVAKRPAAS